LYTGDAQKFQALFGFFLRLTKSPHPHPEKGGEKRKFGVDPKPQQENP
jgi:hypothetical protein